MPSYCLDASFVLARFLPDQRASSVVDSWQRIIDEGGDLVAPPLLLAECTSILHVQGHEGRVISMGEAKAALSQILEIGIRVREEPGLYDLAFQMATDLGKIKAYDTQYLAAASLAQAVLVTADQAMFEGASRSGVAAQLVETT